MTDTTAPLKPKYQLLLGLLPSLNTSLVAIVTACLSIGGTIMTQRYTAKPVEVAPKTSSVTIIEKPAPVDLGPLTMKVEEALAELRAAKSEAGVNRRKKTAPLK
jgi:hypothetical protein